MGKLLEEGQAAQPGRREHRARLAALFPAIQRLAARHPFLRAPVVRVPVERTLVVRASVRRARFSGPT